MLTHVVTYIICTTFKNVPETGIKISFRTQVDYNTEEGYRYLDLVLIREQNYVSVYTRRRWCVIPLEDLDYRDDDTYVKPGKAYDDGASKWEFHGCHDSVWRSTVGEIISKHEKEITGFEGRTENWYSVLEPKEMQAVKSAA